MHSSVHTPAVIFELLASQLSISTKYIPSLQISEQLQTRCWIKKPKPPKATKKNKQSNFRFSFSQCRIYCLETHAGENQAVIQIRVSIPIGVNSGSCAVGILQAYVAWRLCDLRDFFLQGDFRKCAMAHAPEIVNIGLENWSHREGFFMNHWKGKQTV